MVSTESETETVSESDISLMSELAVCFSELEDS